LTARGLPDAASFAPVVVASGTILLFDSSPSGIFAYLP
jgi:hypothetical protein